METKFVKVLFDLECDWELIPPDYRLYVNNELFTERTYRWSKPKYLIEMLQVEAEPGDYTIKLEAFNQVGNFKITNTRIEYGPGLVVDNNTFKIV